MKSILKHKYFFTGITIPALFFSACNRITKPSSKILFQIDSANSPAIFGITETLKYDDLKGSYTITADIPWTDTYWPLTEQGVSKRWGTINAEIENNQIGLAHFLSAYKASDDSFEDTILYSPAEKHDWVLRQFQNNPINYSSIDDNIKQINKMELEAEASAEENTKKENIRKINTYLFSDAAIIKSYLPLTMFGWKTWAQYAGNPEYKLLEDSEGAQWDWMGHCHGWSAAAIMENKPRHAVMVNINAKKILFTEGDIRGLLTKAWAEESPNAFFIGRRCNENPEDNSANLPSDENGRILGGVLSEPTLGNALGFHEIEDHVAYSKALKGFRTITKIELVKLEKTFFVIEPQNLGGSYILLPNFSSLTQYLNTGSAASSVYISSNDFKYYGCRDVNPASLHIILSNYLGKTGVNGKKYRFVMDRTRSAQVWNQPMYKAKLEVDNELTDIKNLAASSDLRRKYHSGGTRYLANASAKLFWSGEPSGPQMVYSANFDEEHIRSSSYYYTLEFDENKKLIGGEWGSIGARADTSSAPDFIYAFPENSKPSDGIVNYSRIVKPLLNCSLTENPPFTTTSNGITIPYSNCILQ